VVFCHNASNPLPCRPGVTRIKRALCGMHMQIHAYTKEVTMKYQKGDIVRLFDSVGVVEEVFTSPGGIVLRIFFAKNAIKEQAPELRDFSEGGQFILDMLEPATVEDMQAELERRLRDAVAEINERTGVRLNVPELAKVE
jgi:hypothetical protein